MGAWANIIASLEDARAAAFELGVIPPIIAFLSIPDPGLRIPASRVLLDIAQHPLGCSGVHQAGGALERLVDSPDFALRSNVSRALANIKAFLLEEPAVVGSIVIREAF
jgi:hypothetical protein